MIILKTTALTIVLGAASSVPLPVVASFVEVADSTYTPTPIATATNGTTPVTVVAAADAGYARQVKLLTVYNPNAATADVTLKHDTTILIKVSLVTGHTLVYTDGRGFSVLNTAGATLTVTSSAGESVTVHNLLDAVVHPDTVAQTVSRGSLIKGNSTPKWDELLIGAAARVLRSDGTDPSWAQVALATDVSGTLPQANGGTGAATLLGAIGTLGVANGGTGLSSSPITVALGGTGLTSSPITVALGGTGATTLLSTGVLVGAGTGAVTATRTPSLDGIAFPATQVDSGNANTLDDYEEGTFTPVLGGETSESGQTYSTQAGNYVKIGSLVHVGIYLQFSAKGTITGGLVVKGLPFASGGGSATHAANVGYFTNAAAGTVNPKHMILGYMGGATSSIKMLAVDNFVAVNPTQMDTTDVNNTTQLIATVSYRTNY